MSFINKLSFLTLCLSLLLLGCDRDNIDETFVPDPTFEPEEVVVNNLISALAASSDEGFELGCLSINYAFGLLLSDGSTIEVFSDEELEAALNQTTPAVVTDFVFPLNVTTDDGENTQIDSIGELAILFASCIPDHGWDNTSSSDGNYVIPAFLLEGLCFELVYPVNLQDANGNAYIANNEAVLTDLIIATPGMAFTLPLTVTTETGEEVIIESVADFYGLFYECEGNTPPSTEGGIPLDLSELGDCEFKDLTIQFPYNVTTEDGESITVTDENQEAALILSEVHYTIEYPFSLVDTSGTVITLNDEAQLIELILPCLIIIDTVDICDTPAHIFLLFFNSTCGAINYPAQLAAAGNTFGINSLEDYLTVYNQFGINEISIVFPISVTKPDGTVATFNNDAEICAFIEEC